MQQVLNQIAAASRESGLFYLDGHGISPALLQTVYSCSTHFFRLPEEFKNQLSTITGGNRYIAEKQYVFGGAKINTGKDFFRFSGNRLYDAGTAEFRPAFEAAAAAPADGAGAPLIELYYRCVFALCRALLKGCAAAQGSPADRFQCLYEHPVLHAQLLQAGRSASAPDNRRAALREPCGRMVILWDDGERAARVRSHMVDAAAPPPAGKHFLLRIADIMARWSHDLHISVPHRVVGDDGKDRYLIPVFYNENPDAIIECSAECPLSTRPKQFSLVV
jgi:isopenicillin N synthase-like dioxygenase